MKPIVDQLPAEIANQIHPDRRKNELEYWAVRDRLISQYRGQWIGFADGAVIASGTSPVAVFHAAESSGRHPFLICVGNEEAPCRIRRVAFNYDPAYQGEPLPLFGPSSAKHAAFQEPRSIGLFRIPAQTQASSRGQTARRFS